MYRSDITQFINQLKAQKPSLEEEQRHGARSLWDKQPIDLDERSKQQSSRVQRDAVRLLPELLNVSAPARRFRLRTSSLNRTHGDNPAAARSRRPRPIPRPIPSTASRSRISTASQLWKLPTDLYIRRTRSKSFWKLSKARLDLLLYLIRKQNFNVLDIPMADVTAQYLGYVDQIRESNLELAGEYLLMAAMLIEIKSRMLLPVRKADTGEDAEDPRAELVRRLLEYEQMKVAAQRLDHLPQLGRDLRARRRLYRAGPDAALSGRRREPTCAPPGPTCSSARSSCSIMEDLARGAVGARAHERHAAPPADGAVRGILRAFRCVARRGGRHR